MKQLVLAAAGALALVISMGSTPVQAAPLIQNGCFTAGCVAGGVDDTSFNCWTPTGFGFGSSATHLCVRADGNATGCVTGPPPTLSVAKTVACAPDASCPSPFAEHHANVALSVSQTFAVVQGDVYCVDFFTKTPIQLTSGPCSIASVFENLTVCSGPCFYFASTNEESFEGAKVCGCANSLRFNFVAASCTATLNYFEEACIGGTDTGSASVDPNIVVTDLGVAPEIDTSSAAAPIALAAGMLLLASERKRKSC